MAAQPDNRWLAECIVEFLRGPLYTNPLMRFIDNNCLIFTPEEENKFEYTTIHDDFKACVDGLLTEFLEELGVSPEEFFRIAEQATDKLTSFVVQTILTVDDFVLFKAMMVKRNMDLTNQVLAAVDELRDAVQDNAPPCAVKHSGSKVDEQALAEQLEQAVQLSKETYSQDERGLRLYKLMRSLQLQDEDVALALAIAESLKDAAKSQAELAEMEQALALSMALQAEQRRLAAAHAAGQAAQGIDTKGVQAPSSSKGSAAGAGADELLQRPFPEPQSCGMAPLPELKLGSGAPLPASSVAPLAPLKVGPNTGADKLSAIAAAAAQAASLLSTSMEAPTTSVGASSSSSNSSSAAATGSQLRSSSGRLTLAAGQKQAPVLLKEKSATAPLNLPDKAPKMMEAIPAPDELAGDQRTSGTFATGHVRNRALGFKSGIAGMDVDAVREAAAAAAATQKGLIAAQRGGAADSAAQAWLQDAKKQLVAQKDAERAAEMASYQSQRKSGVKARQGTGGGAIPDDDVEAKRAALREKLAQKFKQELMTPGSS